MIALEKLNKIIYNNYFFCILLILPFVEPLYFTQIPAVNACFSYLKLAVMAFVIFDWFVSGRYHKNFLFLGAFLLLDCVVTFLNEGNINQMVINAMTLMSMVILFSNGAKTGSVVFLRTVSTILDIMIVINFMVIVLYPSGIYNFDAVNHHYFLGSRNVMMRTIFPGVCFSILRSKAEHDRLSIRTWAVILISPASLVLVWSATALVGYGVFLIFLLLYVFDLFPKWMTFKTCLIILVTVFFAIIVFKLQNIFSFLIVDIMHKDITFTGRVYLWDSCMNYIPQSFLFGYGMEYLEIIAGKLYLYTQYDSAHNFILDIFYQNGFVGVVLLSAIFISVQKRIDHAYSPKYKNMFVLFMLCYVTMLNFEPFINGDMRLFMSMIFYMYFFDENKIEQNRHILKKRKKIIFKARLI